MFSRGSPSIGLPPLTGLGAVGRTAQRPAQGPVPGAGRAAGATAPGGCAFEQPGGGKATPGKNVGLTMVHHVDLGAHPTW